MTHLFQQRLRLFGWGLLTEHRVLALFACLLPLLGLMTAAHSHKRIERFTGPFTQHAQQPAGASNTAKDGHDVRALEPGKPIERELEGGQSHPYQITLAEGQFLNVIVEQRGIDVVVRLLGPDGNQITEFDYETRNQGQETVSQVVGMDGDYRLIVQAKQKGAPAGRYELRVAELRVATEKDRALHEARKLYGESRKLYIAGKYDEARTLAERCLDLREKALGPEHPDVALSLNILAALYLSKSDYVKAEPLQQRALAIWEQALEPDHPFVALSLYNLAILYWSKGDYPKAEPLYQRALASREKAFGPEHPYVADTLNGLALLHRAKGDYAKAEPLYQRALGIREKTLAPEHPDVAASLNNLGCLYWSKGEYVKAESLHQRALAIREKAFGPDHPNVAASLNNLANIYRAKGDFTMAEPIFNRTLVILEKSLGPDHPDVATALYNIASFHAAKAELAQALMVQSRASAISERNITLNLAIGSERQKLAYLATLSAQASQNISLHVHSIPNDPMARRLAATTILQRKARALDAMYDSLGALRQRLDEKGRGLLDDLSNARAQLATLILRGSGVSNPAQFQAEINRLRGRVEQLESEISARSAEFRTQSQPVTLEAVQAAIPQGAMLVEFFSYFPYNVRNCAWGAPRYVAYTFGHRGETAWADLGEAQEIDRAINALRQSLRSPYRTDVKPLARALDEKVMRPIRKLLGETRNVLLSPDGALNLIPFGALVDERNHYLIESYSFIYLTSGRDLLRLRMRAPSKRGPIVIANPMFDLSESAIASDHSDRQNPEARRSVDFSRVSFDPLPSSAVEGRAIGAILPGAKVLTEARATEAAIKQASGPAILHVATHGFFLPDQKPEITDTSLGLGLFPEDPLLRSGLILAGANQRRSGAGEDGILTASEAAGLDLWGTKLVALSACDTGLGEVKNGDGVYGLRRALVLAGAESQVMSLWEVADKATRELMVGYYRGLSQGEGRSEALRNVQLKMLRRSNRRHPFYWAGFIQSGEWANLEGKR